MRRQLIFGSLLMWRCAAQVPGHDGVPADFVLSAVSSLNSFAPAKIAPRAISCTVEGEPRAVRAEGLAELLGDIVIECKGSLQLNPQNAVELTAAYSTQPPQAQWLSIGVGLPVPLASKVVGNFGKVVELLEALVLVDDPVEPLPGATPRHQNPCTLPFCFDLPAHSGSGSFGPPTAGLNYFRSYRPGPVTDGLAGAVMDATGNPVNVFQGHAARPQAALFYLSFGDYDTRGNPRILAAYNRIKAQNGGFYGGETISVPWTKRLRIKNLRARIAGQLPANSEVEARVYVSLSDPVGTSGPISYGPAKGSAVKAAISVPASSPVIGRVQTGLTFQSASANPVSSCVPANRDLLFGAADRFETLLLARYREGFPGAFRTRGYRPGQDPGLDQNDPTAVYETESGFYNSRFPATNGMNQAGIADSATRLRLALNNLPAGVNVFGSVSGTTGTTISAGAYGMVEGPGTAPLHPAQVFAQPGDVAAVGPSAVGLIPGVTLRQGVFELPAIGGRATAYWDVYAANPQVQEEVTLAIGVGYRIGNQLGTGAATVQGSFAAASATAVNQIPAFTANATDAPAFALTPCVTNISACPSAMPRSDAGYYVTFRSAAQAFSARTAVRWNPYGPQFRTSSFAPAPQSATPPVTLVNSGEIRIQVPAGYNSGGGWFEIIEAQQLQQTVPMDVVQDPPLRVCSVESKPTTEGVATPLTVYGFFPGTAPLIPGALATGTALLDVVPSAGDLRTVGSATLPGTLTRTPLTALVESANRSLVGEVVVNARPALNSLDPVLLAAGTTHSSRLRATGGTPPLRWSLRAGTSGAVLRDVPGQPDQQDLVLVTSASIADPQSHSIAVDLQDSLGVSDQVTLAAAIEPLPVLSIAEPGPGPFRPGRNTREVAVMVSPRNAFSKAYKGRVWLEGLPTGSEATLVAGVAGRNSMDIELPACPRTPCPSRVILRLGTVAGALSLRTQTIDVPGVAMPAPLPGASLAVEIPDAPPELSLDRILVAQSNGGLKICAQGVTNTRELVEAQFRFVGTPGSGAGAAFVPPNVSEMFRSFFQPSLAGGSFQFEQNFTVNGNISEVAAVYVQLRNRAGVTGEVGPVELAKAPRCP